MNRSKNFNTSAPINYVAGLGRGATGFTTRSDIGPARMGAEQEGKAETNLAENNFDKFSGYTEQLFGNLPYDDDDEAADLVWGEIDMKMDERRKSRREPSDCAVATRDFSGCSVVFQIWWSLR